MTIGEITARLQNNVTANKLPLTEAVLGSSVLAQYLTLLFGATLPSINVENIDSAAASVSVKGNAELLGNVAVETVLPCADNTGIIPYQFTAALTEWHVPGADGLPMSDVVLYLTAIDTRLSGEIRGTLTAGS